MSSKKHFQEYQFSKFSESRLKIDAQYMENASDIISQKKDNTLEYDSQNDYRKSLAWDTAFFTSPGVLEPEELFQTLNFRDSKPSEQERTNSVCQDNSRRSLAWDNAFFTSAGVLDPEELSLVNKGYKGSGRYLVPNSEDKIWRSAESNSAIKGDGSSLTSLEIDLLDDLKASFDNTTKTSDAANFSFNKGRALTKSDASSRTKSMPASKRQNLNTNGSEKTARLASFPPQAQIIAKGGKCTQLSSLKPPKVLGGVNSPSTSLRKRASLGPKHIRMDNKTTKAASGQHMNTAKRPCFAGSCSVVPNSISSSKSPPSDSYTPSNPTGKSPLSSRLSGSTSPLRNLPRNKIDLLNSSLACHQLSSLKSFDVSPASSVDISSSESFASINQVPDKNTESLDMTPSKETSDENKLYNECCLRHEHQDTRFQNQHVNKKAKGNSSVLKNVSRNIKPSGLKMPSPKIGFFDAENSMALTPNGELKFHLSAHSSSKTGRVAGKNEGAANRTILSKLQQTETGNMKLGYERNIVLYPSGIRSLNPVPLKEEKGSQGFMANGKGVKNKGHHSLGAKNRKDDRTHSSRKILHKHDVDDKENLCSFQNQVDGLTRRMESIDFTQDL